MSTRLLAAFGSVTVLALTLIAPTTAAATTARPALADDCSVLDTSPHQVSIGLKPVTVQFDVGTDCDDEDHKIEWAVRGDYFPTSNVSWFGACTYLYSGPDSYICPDGRAKLDVIGTGTFKGNKMVGPQEVHVSAFDDEDGDDQPDVGEGSADGESSISLLRRTTWGTTFNAAPEPRRKGQTLNITGQVSRANWDTGRYEKFGAYVKLQFRADGEEKFRSVRTVWDNGAAAETKVKATRSGTFRYWYPGDGTHAASASKGDHVKVLRAKN
ncbi:hypothetical protein Kisp01_06170 [Kineosporia sp. NBRC 101677]|uniref:hypothetical protein n=1 Tax=Kineosporia sp. NBRC 101677 TaxID=3032197 RepID=UPI0024A57718|nr:hypothetical protein [Kineosporia sp. NBRC 101677]GLY13601.1 hypothetical protein Kisp01_06170 [Kineosporia sp. NBRC 101677]